jgi:hypothetical protein
MLQSGSKRKRNTHKNTISNGTSDPFGTGVCFCGGKAAEGMNLAAHVYALQRLRMVELYLHSLTRLYLMVLN